MSKEAMQQALEALENWLEFDPENFGEIDKKAITALREALANEALDKKAENARELGLDYEPAQQEFVSPGGGYVPAIPAQRQALAEQPVQQEPDNSDDLTIAYMVGVQHGKKLAQRPWVGLNDDELADFWFKQSLDWMEFARVIEDALRSKNA